MRAVAFFIAATAAILLAGAAAADTPLIYRVDSASATIVRHHLVIRASGAVNSGGWTKPNLVIKKPSAREARTIKVKFVARPPASRDAVIQALLPVSVRKVAPLPRYGAKEVKIIATTNSVTVPITR
jgi:hypothetical protein